MPPPLVGETAGAPGHRPPDNRVAEKKTATAGCGGRDVGKRRRVGGV